MTAQHRAITKEDFTYRQNKSCARFSRLTCPVPPPPRSGSVQLWLEKHRPSRLGDSVGNGTESTELWRIFYLTKRGVVVYKLLAALMQKSIKSMLNWAQLGDYLKFTCRLLRFFDEAATVLKLPLAELEIRELPCFQKARKTWHRFVLETERQGQAQRKDHLSPLISCAQFNAFHFYLAGIIQVTLSLMLKINPASTVWVSVKASAPRMRQEL